MSKKIDPIPGWLKENYREPLGDPEDIIIVSDPDGSMAEAKKIMVSFHRQKEAVRATHTREAAEEAECFAPGTDLGDLLRIVAPWTPEGEREEAFQRFRKKYRRPIWPVKEAYHFERINAEIKNRMRFWEKSWSQCYQQTHLQALYLAAARILQRGWRGSKPRGVAAKTSKPIPAIKRHTKMVTIAGMPYPIRIREISPITLARFMARDIDLAEWSNVLLREGIVGCGPYRRMTPEVVDQFIREFYGTPRELSELTKEIRSFVISCLNERHNLLRSVRRELAKEMWSDLFYGRDKKRVCTEEFSESTMEKFDDLAYSTRKMTYVAEDGSTLDSDPDKIWEDNFLDWKSETIRDEYVMSVVSEGLAEKFIAKFQNVAGGPANKYRERKLMGIYEFQKNHPGHSLMKGRDLEMVKRWAEGETSKVIAAELGIKHDAARKAWERLLKWAGEFTLPKE